MFSLFFNEGVVHKARKRTLPSPEAGVVYLHGAFDLYNPGDVALFRWAREQYPDKRLLVGVMSDEAVAQVTGCPNLPVLSLQQRCLSVGIRGCMDPGVRVLGCSEDEWFAA